LNTNLIHVNNLIPFCFSYVWQLPFSSYHSKTTMTSFYVEVDRWGGRRDKKAEQKVLARLLATPTLLFAMAEHAQSFVDALSAVPFYTVEHFHELVGNHHSRHQQGNPNYHQPEDYKVHRVRILKRFFFIQHETLLFEVHHNPPPGDAAHPTFYICVDRAADRDNKRLAFDRVTSSPLIPDPNHTRTLWTLQVTNDNDLDGNPFNLMRLAALLCAAFRVAPNYAIFGHNCFWHTSAIERTIRDHVLPGHPPAVEDLEHQPWYFRRHRCLGHHMGIPTDADITDINTQYEELLEIDGIQVNQ